MVGIKILFIVILIVVSVASFSFGFNKGLDLNKPPVKMIINECDFKQENICKDFNKDSIEDIDSRVHKNADECAFVGSVYGKKFYPTNCSSVQRIKPDNLTCFSSEDDAVAKGYSRSSLCNY